MGAQGRPGVRSKVLLYGVGVWLLLAVVGVVNGLVRALVLQPVVGEYPAHVAATLLTGIPAFLAVPLHRFVVSTFLGIIPGAVANVARSGSCGRG